MSDGLTAEQAQQLLEEQLEAGVAYPTVPDSTPGVAWVLDGGGAPATVAEGSILPQEEHT